VKKEMAIGLEYRWGWFGAKVFSAHDNAGFNAYVSVPLESREFVPKVNEPAPYTRINPRPTEEQWRADGAHRSRHARALVEQDFADISLGYHNGRLEARLTNTRISSMPRAVGRAARTLLSFAPLEVREIRVTYAQGTLPVATYTFINMPLLQRYFNGMASREQLAPYVTIEYAAPYERAAGDKDAARQETFVSVLADRRGDLSSLAAAPSSARGVEDVGDLETILGRSSGATRDAGRDVDAGRPLRHRIEEVSFFLCPE
jgi:hypothetical protein